MNLAYYFNYINPTMDIMDNFAPYFNENIIIKKFVNLNGSETIYNESIDIELPIISELHLKKNISIERVYLALSDILYNYHNEIYYPVSLHFETENTRAKKISLW